MLVQIIFIINFTYNIKINIYVLKSINNNNA